MRRAVPRTRSRTESVWCVTIAGSWRPSTTHPGREVDDGQVGVRRGDGGVVAGAGVARVGGWSGRAGGREHRQSARRLGEESVRGDRGGGGAGVPAQPQVRGARGVHAGGGAGRRVRDGTARDLGCRARHLVDDHGLTSMDERLVIRSYRRVFEVDRRIYRVDRWALPVPGGVPLRGLGYFIATLLLVVVGGRLPGLATLLELLSAPLRYIV